MKKKLTIKYTLYKVKDEEHLYKVYCNVTYNRKPGRFLMPSLIYQMSDEYAERKLKSLVKNQERDQGEFAEVEYILHHLKNKNPDSFDVTGIYQKIKPYRVTVAKLIVHAVFSCWTNVSHPVKSDYEVWLGMRDKHGRPLTNLYYIFGDLIFSLNKSFGIDKNKTLELIEPMKSNLLLAICWMAFECYFKNTYNLEIYKRPKLFHPDINCFNLRPENEYWKKQFSKFMDKELVEDSLKLFIPEIGDFLLTILDKDELPKDYILKSFDQLVRDFWE